MRAKKLEMRSVIKILSALLAAAILTSCVTGGKEPPFVPTIYVTTPNKCVLVNSEVQTDIVTETTERWTQLYCAPIWELKEIEKKFQQCKAWK
jgi:hypothetical protein